MEKYWTEETLKKCTATIATMSAAPLSNNTILRHRAENQRQILCLLIHGSGIQETLITFACQMRADSVLSTFNPFPTNGGISVLKKSKLEPKLWLKFCRFGHMWRQIWDISCTRSINIHCATCYEPPQSVGTTHGVLGFLKWSPQREVIPSFINIGRFEVGEGEGEKHFGGFLDEHGTLSDLDPTKV
jgi:hypothetical protein